MPTGQATHSRAPGFHAPKAVRHWAGMVETVTRSWRAPKACLPRTSLAIAFGAFVIALPLRARGEDEPVSASLEWAAPPTSRCSTRAALVAAVEARLHRAVFVAAAAADVRLDVTTRMLGTGWAIDLELRDRHGAPLGTRHVRGRASDCADLNESLPLVVALLLDFPRRELPLPAAPPIPVPAVPLAVPAGAPEVPKDTARSPPGQQGARVSIALEGEAASGVVPGLAAGGAASGGVHSALGWSVEIAAGALMPSSIAIVGGGRARFFHAYGGVLGCAPLLRAAVALSLCGGLRLGALLAEGADFDRNEASTRLFPEAVAGARAQLPLGSTLFARLDAGATFSLARGRYVFRTDTNDLIGLYEPPLVAPRVAVGLGIWLH